MPVAKKKKKKNPLLISHKLGQGKTLRCRKGSDGK